MRIASPAAAVALLATPRISAQAVTLGAGGTFAEGAVVGMTQ